MFMMDEVCHINEKKKVVESENDKERGSLIWRN